jgi:integrase
MRRPTGHIRERSPGSWELRYSLGTDPATGKRRTITTSLKGNREAAQKELRRLLRTIDTGEHVDPTCMTVRQWLETWLAAVRIEISPKSHERYSEIVANFLIPALGNLPIAKLAPAHIQNAYNQWSTGGRRDGKSGGLAPRTRRHIHRILKAALSRAVEQQVLARNPADAFKKRLPKVERRDLVTLSAGQSVRLLEAIKHTRVYWPALIALMTGMRRGEVLGLRWKNVDLERATLRVVESIEQTKSGLRFKAPKTEKARAITLPAFALDELRRLKAQQAEELLMLGIRQNGQTLVVGRRTASHCSRGALPMNLPGSSPALRTCLVCVFTIFDTATPPRCCSPVCIPRSPKSVSAIQPSQRPSIFIHTSPIRCRSTRHPVSTLCFGLR